MFMVIVSFTSVSVWTGNQFTTTQLPTELENDILNSVINYSFIKDFVSKITQTEFTKIISIIPPLI